MRTGRHKAGVNGNRHRDACVLGIGPMHVLYLSYVNVGKVLDKKSRGTMVLGRPSIKDRRKA